MPPALKRRSGASAWIALLALATGCRSASNLEIDYRDCIAPKTPYLEGFDDDYQTLLDRCWKAENLGQGRGHRLAFVDSDISIRYEDAQRGELWEGAPPMLLRRIEGDFVFAVQAEAVSAVHAGVCGFCREDAAGIIVRSSGGDGSASPRAAFLIRPYREEASNPPRTCEDDFPYPPLAIAEAQSSEPGAALGRSPGIGDDGEGEIAVCRIGDALSYYYHVRVPDSWQPLKTVETADDAGSSAGSMGCPPVDAGSGDAGTSDAGAPDGPAKTTNVGTGPLEVGLTTTATDYGAIQLKVQGAFNWVALLKEGSPIDDCKSALDDFEEPAN